MTYSEKLKDPRWQKKRLEIFERDDWTCQKCKSQVKTLHVHHLVYEGSLDPWDYPSGYLITLCDCCHQEEHDLSGAPEEFTDVLKKWGFLNSDFRHLLPSKRPLTKNQLLVLFAFMDDPNLCEELGRLLDKHKIFLRYKLNAKPKENSAF